MKKRMLAAVMAGTLLMTAIPVCAEELTNIAPGSNTSVEADIAADDTGDVTYIVSIPDKIDFGTLTMPADDAEAHPKTVGFEVSAVEISGLDTQTSRVAVLVKDAAAAEGKFQIAGVSGTNNSKILEYSILNSANVDLTSGTLYPNGYAFAAFSVAGQTVTGTLSLEQNQLLVDKDLANWAGDYQGTLMFYTAVAKFADYN